MKTLLLVCTLYMHDGTTLHEVSMKGQEIVHKSTDDLLYVALEQEPFAGTGNMWKIRSNDCTYLEDPEAVSRNPELFYPAEVFQPTLSALEYRLWAESRLTPQQIIALRPLNEQTVQAFIDAYYKQVRKELLEAKEME
jgi:hypothetical protein